MYPTAETAEPSVEIKSAPCEDEAQHGASGENEGHPGTPPVIELSPPFSCVFILSFTTQVELELMYDFKCFFFLIPASSLEWVHLSCFVLLPMPRSDS